MGKIYNLYLDESETFDEEKRTHVRSNTIFGIAGVIVEETYANNQLKNEINNVKNKLWGEKFNNYEDLILHEKEIKQANNAYNKYLLKRCKEHNKIFKRNENIKNLYIELEKIIRNGQVVTLAACIRQDELEKIYEKDIQNDRYLVALQIIIENFVHFLSKNDAKGRIFYEYNGDAQTKGIRMRFNMIKTMGTLFISPYVIQERLIDIEFPKKEENVPGLQIADFIPNIIIRKLSGKKLEKYNIYKTIRRVAYNGNSNKDKFGIKVLPF